MIGVILAAGRSRRLLPLTEKIPKCLLKIGGATILKNQITALKNNDIKKIVIVAGFNFAAVKREAEKIRGIKITLVENRHFETTHPIESLAMAEKFINSGFVLLNSDIYFSGKILENLIKNKNKCAIAIDSGAKYEPHEMYVNYTKNFRVLAVSKKLKKREKFQGKSVQISKISAECKKMFFRRINEIKNKNGVFYPTAAYDVLIKKKKFFCVDVKGEKWSEIDTVLDYENAKIAWSKNE